MSQILIQQYLNQLQDLRKVSGTHRESVVREAFKDLLKGWARQHDLIFVPEYEIATPAKDRRYIDGALLHALRMPFGYWEAKDDKDDIDAEIDYKLRRGYPQDNIIFEDSTQAVLIQSKREVMRCAVNDVAELEKLLALFFDYERTEVAEFRKAVEQFKTDLPAVLQALRLMIERAHADSAVFREASERFLIHAKEAINPTLNEADVREMLIQHILTEEIFSKVFGEDDFHHQNNIAKELYTLEGTFFTGDLKKRTLRGLDPYYAAIRSAAAQIGSHHEKQTFLKVIYENFYKVYNKKAADRLGVVYTPNEIVRFMIESADWLCEKHFSRNLIDREVEILDPATGTGTFITELLEHFRGQPAKLKHKYLEELHANEVAILPYYVANLNIEATYAAISGHYLEFPNLCFVDTLDNVGLHTAQHGTQGALFGSMSEENVARIKRQNGRKISVIIGNPPYNANQQNENENNKNREYPGIDQRIKQTYIAESKAQKTKLYDMYARFFRWASDRVAENGIIAFVSNSSFIDKRTFDGFRKVVASEFNEIWAIDLKGDARTTGDRRRKEGGNIFNDLIRVGVAVYFCVKKKGAPACKIYYEAVRDHAKADEKRDFLVGKPLRERVFIDVLPDAKHNWLAIPQNDFELLIPIANKTVKGATKPSQEKAIFKLFSLGISTNRDQWVYDHNPNTLAKKGTLLVNQYALQSSEGEFGTTIKWSRNLKRRFKQGRREEYDQQRIVEAEYRPFHRRFLYDSTLFIDEGGSKDEFFPIDGKNIAICFSDVGSRTAYCVLAVKRLADLHFGSSIDAYQQVPFHRYSGGQSFDNITDWALAQFKKQYQPGRAKQEHPITKKALFHYVYGLLHDPVYREKYAQNLKREFPRIPFYADFWQWAEWGKILMDLHIDYEQVERFTLKRTDRSDEKSRKAGVSPKTILKADKGSGCIILDTETRLSGIPQEAWTYILGTRSALEWILDQHKERKPKDPVIKAKFDTYRFADFKEKVIDLIMRVTSVSVRTVAILEAMKRAHR